MLRAGPRQGWQLRQAPEEVKEIPEIPDCQGPRPEYFLGPRRGQVNTYATEKVAVLNGGCVGRVVGTHRLLRVFFQANELRRNWELMHLGTFGLD